MITVEEMFSLLEATLAGAEREPERVPVSGAAGRILAVAPVAELDLPPFDKSAMDGFAVCAGDERQSYRLLETVAAGRAPRRALEPGTATKVMTGAPVPEGAGRVIMVEDTTESDSEVRVHRHVARSNICPQGEDIERGAVVLPAGTRLGAVEIANLVACGITEVEVARRVRLAIISTGDEVVAAPEDLAPGKILDTNGPLLAGLAAAHGLAVTSRDHLPDDLDATREGIRAAMAVADIVAVSGGISVGQFDYVGAALSALGLRVLFSEVAVKPGRPLTCAVNANENADQVVIALPGNPVAVYLMAHLCLLRVAALLSGAPAPLRELTLPMASDYTRKKGTREEYVPACITPAGTLRPLKMHGSAHLLAFSAADGLMKVPAGVTSIPAGEPASVLPVRFRGWPFSA